MYHLSVVLFNEEGNFDSYLHLGSCNTETGVMLFHAAASSPWSSEQLFLIWTLKELLIRETYPGASYKL